VLGKEFRNRTYSKYALCELSRDPIEYKVYLSRLAVSIQY